MTVTYAQFVQRFPEFACASADRQTQISTVIQEAYALLDECYWGSLYDMAVQYYVADQIARSDSAATSGGGASGAIVSRDVRNEYRVQYADISQALASSGDALQTAYGQMLANLRKRIPNQMVW